MAAPLNWTKSWLAVSYGPSKHINLLKVFSLRFHFNSDNKRQIKNDNSGVVLDELFKTQREEANITGKSKTKSDSRTSTSKQVLIKAEKFQDILRKGRNEARRSVLVRTQHPESTIHRLQTFGSLAYAGFTSTERSYVLAQYKDVRHVESLIRGSSWFSGVQQFPMRSRCLLDNPHSQHGNRKKVKVPFTTSMAQTYPENRAFISYEQKKSFDEEVLSLHSKRTLNKLDLRLRFFVCSLLEDMLKPLLSEPLITPYGSCLNGFGWWDGDLDMMLSFNATSFLQPGKNVADASATSFKFLTEVFKTERHMAQHTLSAMASIIELMPRFTHVLKILNARVPIVRFRHAALDLQCDLSVEALDSIKMTEILYLLSTADARVRPLMTVIKQWALHHKLTADGTQQKPTTLGFLCLLIFYLQTCQPPVLPSLRHLQASAQNLLTGFFTFFASFNFEKHAISLIEGSTFTKSDQTSPLYIENPLCIGLNICKNVSQVYVEHLQQAMRLSARTMEELSRISSLPTPRLNTLFNKQPLDDSFQVNIDSLFTDEEIVADLHGKQELTDSNEAEEDVEKKSFGFEDDELKVGVTENSHKLK